MSIAELLSFTAMVAVGAGYTAGWFVGYYAERDPQPRDSKGRFAKHKEDDDYEDFA